MHKHLKYKGNSELQCPTSPLDFSILLGGSMSRFRLGFIFLLMTLILMSCNLTNMLPSNQGDSDSTVEETAESSLDDTQPSEPQENTDDSMPSTANNNVDENNDEMQSEDALDTNQENAANNTQSTACDHPYFPIREGSNWVYFEPENSYYHHWNVLSVEGDKQNATAVMTDFIGEFSELTEEAKSQMIRIEYNWVCSADEGIVSFDLAVLDLPEIEGQEFEMTLTFVDGEGVMLPPAEKMNVGDTWDMKLQMDFSMPELLEAEGTMTLNDFYTVVNHDKVEVLGRDLEGLQYNREFDIEMEINIGGVSTSMPTQFVDYQTITTLAKGVGFVTFDSEGDFGNSGLQLISYNIP